MLFLVALYVDDYANMPLHIVHVLTMEVMIC